MKRICSFPIYCYLHLPKLLITLVFFFFSAAYTMAQKAGFTATIGVNTFTASNGTVLHVCKGGSITYTTTATGYYNLSWRYTNGGAAITNYYPAFTVTYPDTGKSFYTVQKLSFFGKPDDSIKVTVVVAEKDPALDAAFTYTPGNTVCASTNFSFDGSSSKGKGLTYYWDFGDNTTATGVKVNHSFVTAVGSSGTQSFNVKLIVTNQDGCTEEIIKTITVTKIPDASLGNDAANAELTVFNGISTFRKCMKLDTYTFTFINKSTTTSTNTNYKINWGDGSADFVQTNWALNASVQHTFSLGNTVITFSITNGTTGCTAEKKYNVFIGTNSEGSISLSSTTGNAGCTGTTLDFPLSNYENNTPGTLYYLYVNDGSPFPNPLDSFVHPPPAVYRHTFTSSSCGKSYETYNNSFYIKLIAENACNLFPAGNSAYPIYISDTPNAKLYADSVACVNTPVGVSDYSFYGSVINSTDNQLNCTSDGKRLWKVTPSANVTVSPANGLGSYSGNFFDWDNWVSGYSYITLTFKTPGTYTIKLYISNNNNCKIIDSVEKIICVREVPKAVMQFSAGDSCNTSTVKFIAAPQNSCSGNKYTWSVASSDPSNCSASSSYSFVQNTNSNSDTAFIKFTGAGKYNVYLDADAKAANSCPTGKDTGIITIKAPPLVTINSIASICVGNSIAPAANVTDCYSGSTLTYKWKFPGGSPDSSINANPGSITYNATGIQTVSLSVTNSCGTTTTTKTFDVVANPVAKAGADIVMCSGEQRTIGGNTENYSFDWLPKTGLSSYDIAQPKITYTNNGTKNDTLTYYLTVSGGVNCKDYDTVTVVVKPSPIVSVDKPAAQLCKGDAVTITSSGAETYTWSPDFYISSITGNTVTVNPPSSQTYTVTGSKSNGCSDNTTIAITVVDKPVANAGSDITICSGSSGTIGVYTGSYNYQWSPANGLDDAQKAQPSIKLYNSNDKNDTLTYNVTVTAGSCYNTDAVQVVVKKSPAIKISPAKTEVCNGNSIQITVSGADIYSWFPSDYLDNTDSATVIATPPVTTTYNVSGALANGCFADTSITVTVRPDAKAYFDTSRTNFCTPYNLNSVINATIYPDRNNLYKWYINDSLYATNTNGAVPNFPVNNAGDSVLLKLVTTSKYNCRADSISIKLTSNAATNAVFAFTPKSGCEPLNIYFQNTTSNLSSASYSWDFGNDEKSNLIQPDTVTYTTGPPNRDTTYYITLTADNGCKVTTYRDTVIVLAKPSARIGINNVLLCSGQTINLKNTSLGSNLSFIWVFGNGDTLNTTSQNPFNYSFSTIIVDTFTIKLFALNNCGIDSNSIDVRVAPNTIQAQLSAGADDLFGCTPHEVMFKNNTLGASKYVWKFGDNTDTTIYINNPATISHTYTAPGIYKASLFLSNGGCTDTTVYQTITVYAAPAADFTTQAVRNNVYCFGDTIYTFNNSSNADQYQWLFGDGSPANGSISPFHYYNTTGTYEITLYADKVNDYGIVCTDSVSKIIKLGEKPLATATSSDTIRCFKNSSQLLATGGVIYHWQPDTFLSNTNTANPVSYATEPITYTVDITGASGCVVTDSVKVFVNLQLTNANELPIANAFSPNGDGHNDDFGLSKLAVISEGFKLWIYDRWGKLLFYTTDPQRRWNGTFNGTLQPAGTYVFQAEFKTKCLSDETILQHQQGTVVLIR